MSLNKEAAEALKTKHPEQWENFTKHVNAFKAEHGPCDEAAALYFYSAGAREVSDLVRELGKALSELPTL